MSTRSLILWMDSNQWVLLLPDYVVGAARYVLEALTDQTARKRVHMEARTSAVERFSFDNTVSGTISIYKEILDDR